MDLKSVKWEIHFSTFIGNIQASFHPIFTDFASSR